MLTSCSWGGSLQFEARAMHPPHLKAQKSFSKSVYYIELTLWEVDLVGVDVMGVDFVAIDLGGGHHM